MSLLPLLPGAWQARLDRKALEILMTDRELRGLKALADKQEWLSEDQLELRREREVTSVHEIDKLHVSGLYCREYNPMIGKRPSGHNLYGLSMDPWRQGVYESIGRA